MRLAIAASDLLKMTSAFRRLVDTGSRHENTSKQKAGASVPIQSERKGSRAAIELSSCDGRQTILIMVDWDAQPRIDREIAPSLDRGWDRGQPMRILSISLLMFASASAASAQSPPSVDCNAVKNSVVPFELIYHGQEGTRTVVQSYRDKSGNDVVWSRQTPPSTHPNPPVFVTKATYVDGVITSSELSTPYVGKYSHRTAKYTHDGLSKNFDRRSDVTFKTHAVITSGDDTTEEKTSTISYKFKSEGTAVVGSCVLQVIHGEIDTTNDAVRTRHTFQVYFPELKISATDADAEPVVDSLSTVFSEIKPVN